jgi:hypothetical protein
LRAELADDRRRAAEQGRTVLAGQFRQRFLAPLPSGTSTAVM